MKELRAFKSIEFIVFQGANSLPNGARPMIADGENATLILAGFDPEGFGIEIIPCENGGFLDAFKAYDNLERAVSDAKIFAQLLDCDLTKEFLNDFGFEVVL